MAETAGAVRKMKGIYNPFFKNEGIGKIIHDYPEIEFETVMSAVELERAIEGADILIANNRSYDEDIARVLKEKGSSLKWIQFSTAGIERAIKFGLPRGVPVCCAAGIKGRTVAEHTMALLLALYRQFRAMEAARKRREWARHELNHLTRTVEGETLVLIGFGHIGQEIARKAKAFDMRVTGVSRSTAALANFDALRPREELVDAAREADVLMVAALYDDTTHHVISRDVIGALGPRALVVNIARGMLVDETALVEALVAGRIGGAGLDVMEVEPLPASSPLWTLDNVLVTPHIGGAGSKGTGATHASMFSDNLKLWLAGKPLEKVVIQKT